MHIGDSRLSHCVQTHSDNKGDKTLLKDVTVDFWETCQNKEFNKRESKLWKDQELVIFKISLGHSSSLNLP